MFEYADLNMQFMPQDYQYGPCPLNSQPPCFCTFRPCTFRPTWCPCNTRPITFCAIPSPCRCLTRLLTCICLSKPIASVPPRTIKDFTIYEQVTGLLREVGDPADFDVLRVELQEALKQVDTQQKTMQQYGAPQTDAEFDAAEQALQAQLEELKKQRAARGGRTEKK
jgi:hypothetical protein